MNPLQRKRRAFTLIEVMIAIAILSVVIAAIYGTWRALMGASRVTQIVASQVQEERVALRCIEQSLTSAVRYEANQEYYYFVTPNDLDNTLSFVCRLPESFPRSGRFGNAPVRRVAFSLQPGEDQGNDLVLRQQPLLAEDFDEDEREHPLVLMHNVKKMTVECWDMQRQDWTEEWTTTNLIPPKIRVALTMQDPKGSFRRDRELVQEVVPASVGVLAVWQGRGPGQPPPNAPLSGTPVQNQPKITR